MDKIRVAKVEGVRCSTKGSTDIGTVHLTAHHLIFKYDQDGLDELWTAYPLISLVTRMPHALDGTAPLAFRLRTFETFTLLFEKDIDALDVFESVKELTVVTSVTQLYAFFYKPNPPLPSNEGWTLYTPRDEFARMGVGSRTKAWRYTDINKDYNFCSTYPAKLVIPSKISDATLQYAVKYRSKSRIPVLAYLHWANLGTLTRSSQPMVGLTNNRSIQDEKLVEAIFQSHLHADSALSASKRVYGATATNLIIDARPTANAMVMVAKGAGTENMDYYKDCRKAYLGIDNIHVMRDSLNKVFDALREADALAAVAEEMPEHGFVDRHALRRSGWLKHMANLLEGTVMIVYNVHINASHVLIHCSDGWDRTSQLSALAQICLDPFYRTYRGFQVLVEKDWLSFGHKFLDRCGHLSSEKLFMAAPSGDADGPQAFLASVSNRFGGPAHLKETSPVFHQFLETVRQIQRQFPTRFEYNARYLERVHHHLYSCQFGTFLFNNERELRAADAHAQTISIWDWLNAPEEKALNLNPEYDAAADDPKGADMGVLVANPKDVRFWNELYGRTDDEMNGRITNDLVPSLPSGPIENSESDPVLSVATSVSPSPSPSLSQSVPAINAPAPVTASEDDAFAASVPALPPKPQAVRQDSFRPYTNTNSAFSLRARTPEPPALPAIAATGSAAVKSMWAQFSSGAGVALSAAQNAYSGAAKELNSRIAAARDAEDDAFAASVPALPPKPQAVRQDSFRPYTNTNSAFSLRARTPEPPALPAIAATGSAAVKSMWAQFSSGAGVALSAAQNAYSGAAKELNSRIAAARDASATPPTTSSSPGGELRSRDELPAWGAAEWGDVRSASSPTSPSRRATPSPAPAPATNVPRAAPRSMSALASNPWASTAPAASTSPVRSAFTAPTPRLQPSLDSLTLNDPVPSWRPPSSLRREEPPLPPPPPPDKDNEANGSAAQSQAASAVTTPESQASDPLGVGLL
ncbi:phosphatases II [Auricularia subglabra TFB-10046 SS5]|nr:phosphatases II [Auricularia subglabra TFB-10046 SS5]